MLAGALLLAGLVLSVDMGEVGRALASASVAWLVAAIGLSLAFLAVRAWRWHVIIQASAPASRLTDALAITALGWAINSVFPFKLGEIVRIASLGRRARIGLGESGATVVLERLLDVLALLLLALLAAAVSGARAAGAAPWQRIALLSLLTAAAVLLAFWLVRNEERSLRLWAATTRRLPGRFRGGALALGASAMRGLQTLRSPGRLAACGALSLLTWALAVAGLYSMFRAVSPQLTLLALTLALTLFVITQGVSLTPASIGTYELFYIGTLTAFGASPRSVITAAAVLSHGVATIAFLAAGALGALWLRLVPASPPVGLEQALAGQDRA